MIHGYRAAESHLFGSTTALPGESDMIHSELSGLNMGQRLAIHHATEKMDIQSPDSGGTTDLTQALMSRYNPSSSE